MESLSALYRDVASALDGQLPIEEAARAALLRHSEAATFDESAAVALPAAIADVMLANDAHPCCKTLLDMPLPWLPPVTSDDPAYQAVNAHKVLVELVGPDGLVRSDNIRVGVYGIKPGVHYGVRTHPAEELFVTLAGRGDWLKNDEDFAEYGPGARRHHGSMEPHATRTREFAFMSIYVWTGNVSFEDYVYQG